MRPPCEPPFAKKKPYEPSTKEDFDYLRMAVKVTILILTGKGHGYRDTTNTVQCLSAVTMKWSILLICIALVSCSSELVLSTNAKEENITQASLIWTGQDFEVVANEYTDTPDTVAWATFDNQITTTGWSYLEVKTFSNVNDNMQV